MKTAIAILMLTAATAANAGVRGKTPNSPENTQAAEFVKSEPRRQLWVSIDKSLTGIKPAYDWITFAECGGDPNAFYGNREITVCYEQVRELMQLAGGDAAIVTGGVIFSVLHEYGHAAIAASEIPVLGREEDAADQVAAILASKVANPVLVMRALLNATMKKRPLEMIAGRRAMADQHSLDPQRRANMACWMLGDNPGLMNEAIQAGVITAERANRCQGEQEKAERAVKALLSGQGAPNPRARTSPRWENGSFAQPQF